MESREQIIIYLDIEKLFTTCRTKLFRIKFETASIARSTAPLKCYYSNFIAAMVDVLRFFFFNL